MYILYGSRFTRTLIVEMVMAEGDIPYELREIDILKQEHRSSEYLTINPAGWIPSMITPEGDTLYETPAISLYLAEHHHLTQVAPRVDEAERGLFLSGLFYLTGEFEPAMKRYFYPHRYVIREKDIEATKKRSLSAALDRLRVIDGRLAKRGPFHLGDRFSLLDMTMSYWTAYLEVQGVLDPYPAIRRCTSLAMERPALHKLYEDIKELQVEYANLQARGEGVT